MYHYHTSHSELSQCKGYLFNKKNNFTVENAKKPTMISSHKSVFCVISYTRTKLEA